MAESLSDLLGAILPPATKGVGLAEPVIRSLTVQGTMLDNQAIRAASLGGVVEKVPILSANEIIRRVRSMGIGVRRQNALQFIKAIRAQISGVEYVQGITPGRRPLRDSLPFASHRQRLPYQYTVMVTGHDSLTGELGTQYIRINTTRLTPKNQIQAQASDVIFAENKYALSDITDAVVTLITRQNPNIAND